MKPYALLCLLFSFALLAHGQDRPLRKMRPNTAIDQIRAEFQRINAQKDLEIRQLESEDFMEQQTDGGAKLTAYFEGESLCKMVRWVGVSQGFQVTEYYLKNGHLFFIYDKEVRFGSKLDAAGNWQDFDYQKTETAFEGRYYWQGENLIRNLESGSRMISPGSKPQSLRAESQVYQGLFTE